mgnify:CR=1 FL=1
MDNNHETLSEWIHFISVIIITWILFALIGPWPALITLLAVCYDLNN